MIQNKHIKSFIVPDGSHYLAICSHTSKKDIFNEIPNFREDFLNSPKTRITWDDPTLADDILNTLEKLTADFDYPRHIKKYQTNFFKTEISELRETIQNHPQISWQNYETEFFWRKFDAQNPDDIWLLRDFMLNSFGVDFKTNQEGMVEAAPNETKRDKIIKNLSNAYLNTENQIYFVFDKNNLPAGCFTLIDVCGDIQLNSVAGISGLPSPKVRKLPLILAAVFNVLELDAQFKNAQKLTFSNSKDKVSQIYTSLGIKRNLQRQGFFVEK
jgi:hypothetical protein